MARGKSSGGGSGVRGTYSKAGVVVKRGAGGRFMGSIKYRTDNKYARSTGGVGFREARATYNQATHFARQATDASLKQSLKFHQQFGPHGSKRTGPRSEYSQMVAGAAVQRELRRRGYGVHQTRMGTQVHSPASGVNTGAKAARANIQQEVPKKLGRGPSKTNSYTITNKSGAIVGAIRTGPRPASTGKDLVTVKSPTRHDTAQRLLASRRKGLTIRRNA